MRIHASGDDESIRMRRGSLRQVGVVPQVVTRLDEHGPSHAADRILRLEEIGRSGLNALPL